MEEVEVFLYDSRGKDEIVEVEDVDCESIKEDQLVWVNVSSREVDVVGKVLKHFGLDRMPVRSICEVSPRPYIANYENAFVFAINSMKITKGKPPEKIPIELVVTKNVVITIHDGPIEYFDEFRDQEKEETEIGSLDAESFVAMLCDLHISTYFRALEEVESQVDKLDLKVLKRDVETDEFLVRMVQLRGDVAKIRRWLIPHRNVIYSFLHSHFQQITSSNSQEEFKTLSMHFESAVDATEISRETVLGTFELFATKSSQLMNIFIQRLTFFTLITGSLSVIAGVLGMNYKASIFESDYGFTATVVGMVLVGIALTLYARHRRWI